MIRTKWAKRTETAILKVCLNTRNQGSCQLSSSSLSEQYSTWVPSVAFWFVIISLGVWFILKFGQTELLTKNCRNNCSGTGAEPNMKKVKELAWTYVKKKLWRSRQTGVTEDNNEVTEKEGDQGILGKVILRKKCRQQDIQAQREKDGDGSTRQRWMEICGLWPMFHRELQIN